MRLAGTNRLSRSILGWLVSRPPRAARRRRELLLEVLEERSVRAPVSGSVSGLWDDTAEPYVLTGDIHVDAGSTLTISPGVEVQTDYSSYELFVYGTLDASMASFTGRHTEIVVYEGGELNLTNSCVVADGLVDYRSGSTGSLLNSQFPAAELHLRSDSVEVTGNTFSHAVPVTIGPSLVPELYDNTFDNAGAVTIQVWGTADSDALWQPFSGVTRYQIDGDVTVTAGTTLTLVPGTEVYSDYSGFDLLVEGSLEATGVDFTGEETEIVVVDGGRMDLVQSTAAGARISYESGSSGTVFRSAFELVVEVHSQSAVRFDGNHNRFADASVLADGDSAEVIDMRGNWWGSTDPASIGSRITDQEDDPGRPLVAYDPPAQTARPIDSVAVHRSDTWFLDQDGNHRWNGDGDEYFRFGVARDKPLVGDWNGDGLEEAGVHRPSTGMWYLDSDGSRDWNNPGDDSFAFGIPGDNPVVGDWNGDGVDQIGVHRPATGMWYLDGDGSRSWNYPGDVFFAFGIPGDNPVVGDWNGDGVDQVGVHRPTTGMWYLDADGNCGWNNPGDAFFAFGIPGDEPVVGDWSGDGTDQVGVHRPTTGMWYLDADGNGRWDNPGDDLLRFGVPGDEPVVGRWQAASPPPSQPVVSQAAFAPHRSVLAAGPEMLGQFPTESASVPGAPTAVEVDSVFAAEPAALAVAESNTMLPADTASNQVTRSNRLGSGGVLDVPPPRVPRSGHGRASGVALARCRRPLVSLSIVVLWRCGSRGCCARG